jgi:murein L,D-transpeptidase YcbB/YkuD
MTTFLRSAVAAVSLLLLVTTSAAAQDGTPDFAAPAASASALPASPDAAPSGPTGAAAPAGDAAAASIPAPNPTEVPARPKKRKPARAAKSAPLPRDPWSTLPTFDQGSLERLNALSRFYAAIARQGGFPPPPPAALGPRSSGAPVLALRRRLVLEGDLAGADAAVSPSWDQGLTEALQRFQMRYGLASTGTMNERTRAAMAVPVEQRLAQVGRNMERLGARFVEFGRRYVVVNIPGAQVEAVENGATARRYVAVVGRPGNASPQVDAVITAVNVNPTWTVPQSILKNEFAPKLAKDPSVLARQNMKVLDGSGREVDPAGIDWTSAKALNYTLRQGSGGGNALGQLRIQMPNPDAVYMHDTPSKKLFGATERFFSHGCVRVQGVNDLAAWLLGADWDAHRIAREIATGERKDLPLADHVPVHWVYMTAYVTPDGTAHFRNDVYGLDVSSRFAEAR